jgi:hypothetical protein
MVSQAAPQGGVDLVSFSLPCMQLSKNRPFFAASPARLLAFLFCVSPLPFFDA